MAIWSCCRTTLTLSIKILYKLRSKLILLRKIMISSGTKFSTIERCLSYKILFVSEFILLSPNYYFQRPFLSIIIYQSIINTTMVSNCFTKHTWVRPTHYPMIVQKIIVDLTVLILLLHDHTMRTNCSYGNFPIQIFGLV